VFFRRSACTILRAEIGQNVSGIVTDGVDFLAHLIADGFTEGIWDGVFEGIIDGPADVLLCVEDDAVGIINRLDVPLFDRRIGSRGVIAGFRHSAHGIMHQRA